MTTSGRIEKIVADANVLLSSVIGKAALKIFTRTPLVVAITAYNLEEVRKYLPRLASRYHIEEAIVQTQLSLLPLEVHEESSYASFLVKACQEIGEGDPDDIHPLALSLKLEVPLWSNDRDFDHIVSISVYPTAKLLKIMGFEHDRSRRL